MSEGMKFGEICKRSYSELSRDEKTTLYYTMRKDEGKYIRDYVALEIHDFAAMAFGCSEYILCGEEEPATEKQLNYISRLAPGFPTEAVYYKRQASMVIEKLLQRKKTFPNGCTFRQARLLSKRIFRDVEKFTFEEAKELITILQKNHFHANYEFNKKVREFEDRRIVIPTVEVIPEIELW